ncbi:MAG: type 4a pilus biogenesis protein PilO [Candidatus Omnitrophica bacterium]|nr:type 4a pilus biogenesis protein PilO [Candidatus Omnitrophota bacterium]
MVISKRERILFIATLLFVLLSLIYSLAVEPAYKEYIILGRQIKLKQAQLRNALSLIEERKILGKEFEKYAGQFMNSEPKDETDFLLAKLEEIGKANGVYLNEARPQGIKDSGFYQEMSVDIKFKATIRNLAAFIYKVESSPLLLRINVLRLHCKDENNSSLEGDMEIGRICFNS